jgi:hypothetical protein
MGQLCRVRFDPGILLAQDVGEFKAFFNFYFFFPLKQMGILTKH